MISDLQFLLVGVVCYLGLLAGLIISLLSKEELKPGRKYFVLLQHAILIVSLVIFLYSNELNIFLVITLGALLALLLALTSKVSQSIVAYPFMALFLSLSRYNSSLFFLLAALAFLYGLPTASLQMEKSYLKPFLLNLGFLVVLLISALV
ncbi:MAG: hypothetical protein V1837_00695 [Candidatus Woesearchaeota archaeon]